MSGGPEQIGRTNKLLLALLVLFVALPVVAVAGWLIWLASEQRPWLMSFGTVLAVIFLTSWPLEYWLERRAWFKRMTGEGQFRDAILKFPTLYLPLLVVVGVNDLDHKRSLSDTLREYLLTIAGFFVLPIVAAIAAIGR